MNAHIQIPQLLLRKFQHQEIETYEEYTNIVQCVYFLDLVNNLIDFEKVRLFGTEVDFYGECGEKKLSKNVEEPFGAAINKILNDNREMLNVDDYISIKRFAYFCVLRSKNVLNTLVNNEYLTRKKKNTPDTIIKLVNDKNGYSNSFIEILINHTDNDFVIPNNCLIFTSDNQVLPISPRIALTLRKKISYEIERFEFIEKQIVDPEYIEGINRASVGVEKRNRGIIIAKEKQTLINLSKNLGIKICERKGDA